MGDGATLGDVYVDVSPKALDFWTKFQAQTQGQAGKVGADLGAQVGKGIQDKISKGVLDGLERGSREAVTQATRAGEESGGRFADGFRRRVEAALKALPKAEIGASATEADQKIKEIRAQLEALSGKKVGVDISDAEALAKVTELTAQLDDLGAKSPNVQVKTDAAFASAELAKITFEAERVAALHPTVQVDADTAGATAQLAALSATSNLSTGSMSGLITAGVALGPALIPAAAGATAAIGALGAVAFTVGSAIGVLALAIIPVVAAVKALSDASDGAGQSASAGASGQLQMAGAIDQVRSARASLANTVLNAADGERRAVDQVASAEKALVQAQQASLKAQQAINGARAEARRTLEDLSSQVAQNALAQRQAALQLTDAQNVLDAVNASPLSTARQRADAQLTYDQAKQQILDLGVQQTRLAEDHAQAQAKGIDGSAQVVAAEQSVTQAVEDVRKAEKAVADARIAQTAQARQDAFAIAQAQQGVVSAQRAVQAASISAGSAGGAAATNMATAFAALSPIGQGFARFLYGLKPIFTDLSMAAQDGLFPGLQAGIQAILPIMPTVTDFVRRLAGVMGELFKQAGQALASPFWQSFFQQMASLAIPIMQQMGPIILDVAKGFAGLLLAFAPLAPQIGGGLASMAAAFANFGTTAASNPQFQKFLSYVQETGPQVLATIGSIVLAGLHLAEALAPIGGVVLVGIKAFADLISAIPTDVLTALAAGIIAVVVALKAWALIGPIVSTAIRLITGEVTLLNLVMDANPVVLVIIAIAALVAGVIYAYNHFAAFRKVVDAVWEGIKTGAMFVWNNVLKPVFDWLKKELPIVGAFFAKLWNEHIQPALSAIGTAAMWIWHNVLEPVFQAIGAIIRDVVAPLFSWLWHHVIEPMWEGIKVAFQIGWALISIVFGLIEIYIKAVLAPIFSWLWHTIIEPIWHAIAAGISWVWENVLKPVFKAVGGFISDTVAPAFKTAVEAIGKAWDGLRELAKKPVAFVVNSIINPLIRGYNDLAETFHVGKVKEIPGFATGGLIDGPGGPRDDAILARLSAGEYIIPAHVVAQLGANFFDELIGGGARSRYAGDGSGGIAFPGFADGGLVGFAKDVWSVFSDPSKILKGPAEAAIAKIPGASTFTMMLGNMGRSLVDSLVSWITGSGSGGGTAPGDVGKAQAYLRAQVGKPYLWASAGPDGFDCSGIVSAVYNMLHGKAVNNHTFSTMNQSGFFPLPGAGGPLTAGWTNPGERGPGGDSVGHTAGVLAGIPFESTGGVGVRIGAGITPVTSFAHLGHYDNGGWLPRGLTIARNDTGQPEAILTADQWKAMQDRRGGNTITIPVHGGDGMNVKELAAAVAGELAWQMR